MHVELFEMERYQSIWENIVDYNLSESGVYPFSLKEFLSSAQLNELLEVPLGYNQTNGSEALRSAICSLYDNCQAKNVLVTTGSAEANFLTIWRLVERGDSIALMLPNYMQIWGIARAFGAEVKPFHLVPFKNRWQIDWDELEKSLATKTKLIAICNPNNPTGAQLNEQEISRLCQLAQKKNAWILADEVYRSAERLGELTASFWGKYDKAIVTCGLSKAYGLSGLRLGWVLAPEKLIEELWGYHDYTTICLNPISDRLAWVALQPAMKKKIKQRTRSIIQTNYQLLLEWMKKHDGLFEHIPPAAGAITMVKHYLPLESSLLVEKLRVKKSVLIVPGEQFKMKRYLRIGFGCPAKQLDQALQRVSEFIQEMDS